jgi:excinuclease ABC subunit C
MDAILREEVFTDFGQDLLVPWESVPTQRVTGKSKEELRDQVRKHLPKSPGVYGMIDVLGRLIYVGKSKSLRHRVASYFLPTNEDEKSGRIIQSATQIAWEPQPNEFAALLREQYLIRMRQPRFNVQGLPQRQKPVFLCLGRTPAELFYVNRFPDTTAKAWAGPFFGSGRLGRAAQILNRHFQLRDCPNSTKFHFTDQLALFDLEHRPGCLRHEIGNCLGPCVAACARQQYETQVRRGAHFLKQPSETIEQELASCMQQLSQRRHFEQAAILLEDMQVIQWLHRRLQEHANARRELTCVYPVMGENQREVWYLLRRGVVEHAIASPATTTQRNLAIREIHAWYHSEGQVGHRFVRREETLAIVSGWFRKYPQERRRLLDLKPLLARKAK